MKYCQYCGTQLSDNANFCINCGKPTSQPTPPPKQEKSTASNNPNELITKLSSRIKTNAIIWIVIACFQILIGLVGAWFVLIVGLINIYSAITNIKVSKRILTNPNGIVKAYEPITSAIITLVYNLIAGGVIGVAGSIYFLVCVRGFVMENKDLFLAMETEDGTWQMNNENEVRTEITITEEEALHGVQKDISVEGLHNPVKLSIPKNMKDGNYIKLSRVCFSDEHGEIRKKDVIIKVNVLKQL